MRFPISLAFWLSDSTSLIKSYDTIKMQMDEHDDALRVRPDVNTIADMYS